MKSALSEFLYSIQTVKKTLKNKEVTSRGMAMPSCSDLGIRQQKV